MSVLSPNHAGPDAQPTGRHWLGCLGCGSCCDRCPTASVGTSPVPMIRPFRMGEPEIARDSCILRSAPDRAGLPAEPLLSRFARCAGFVTLHQTFVRRCHGGNCPLGIDEAREPLGREQIGLSPWISFTSNLQLRSPGSFANARCAPLRRWSISSPATKNTIGNSTHSSDLMT